MCANHRTEECAQALRLLDLDFHHPTVSGHGRQRPSKGLRTPETVPSSAGGQTGRERHVRIAGPTFRLGACVN